MTSGFDASRQVSLWLREKRKKEGMKSKGKWKQFWNVFLVNGLAFVMVAISIPGLAKEKVIELEKVVVTAPKEERELEHVPGRTTVITEEEIRVRNVQNPAKALEQIPGIYVKTGKGPTASQQRISIRGMSENRCQILRDGHRMNSSFYAGMKSWNQVPVEDIERIEVINGPYSALYGGWGGLGGVINIVTKMPEKQQFCLKSLYGTDDLWGGTVTYGNKFFDKLSVYLSYDYKATNGYVTDYITKSAKEGEGEIPVTGWKKTTDSKGNPKYLIGDKGDYMMRNWSILAKARLDLPHDSKLTFTFNPYRYDEDYDQPHTYLRNAITGEPVWEGDVTFDDGGQKKINVRPSSFLGRNLPRNLYRYALDYEIPFAPMNTLKASFELNDERRERIFGPRPDKEATFSGGPGTFQRNPKSMDWRGRVEWNLGEIYGFNNFTLGTEYYEEKGGRKRWQLADWRDERSKVGLISESWGRNRIVSFFAQDEMTLTSRLTLYLGGRIDYWRLFNRWSWDMYTGNHPASDKDQTYFSPKFSVKYRPLEATTLRLSLAKSFNAPMLHDLVGGYSKPGYVSLPSPNLKPEKVKSWEIGVDQEIGKRTRLECSYFENYAYDLRYRKRWSEEGITYSAYENAEKGRIRGVELGIEHQIFSFLRAYTNGSYQDAKFIRNSVKPGTEHKRITGIPQKMCNFGLMADYGGFKGSLTGHYVGKVYYDDLNRDKKNHVYGSYDPYFTLDTKVSYELRKGLEFSFAVDNLLDKDYYQSYKAPGRYLFGEVVYRY